MNIWFISKYASPPLFAKAPSRLFYLAKETKKLGNDVRLITSDANHFTSIPKTGKLYNYEQQEGVDIIWINLFCFWLCIWNDAYSGRYHIWGYLWIVTIFIYFSRL